MTFETPLHAERVLLPGERHPVDAPVAGFTTEPFVHVNAVVEIDEIGQIVHPSPPDRLPGAITRAHRLERRTRVPDLRMTVHARLRGRDVGETGRFHGRVAVTAIDT